MREVLSNPHRAKSASFDFDFKHQSRAVMLYKNLEELIEDEKRMMYDEERDDAEAIFEAGRQMMRSIEHGRHRA